MKKEELLKLETLLNSEKVKRIVDYPLFSYIRTRVLDLITNEVNAIRDIVKEFETERDKIYLKYAEKNDKDEPLVIDNRLKIPKESFEDIKKELNNLLEEHKKSLETFDKVIKEESDIVVPKINILELKGIGFDTSEIEILDPMLKYEEV